MARLQRQIEVIEALRERIDAFLGEGPARRPPRRGGSSPTPPAPHPDRKTS
jgi:hypothetical protein